ncbi:MAG: HEPN domain-containing protein [Bacteroidales bacterium]
MTRNTDDLIHYRISRSKDTLKEAESLISNGFWNAAVNRIYYACYYAVSGLLLRNAISSQTHKGVRQMFGLHYVQTGLISRDLGKFFTNLYDKRQTGDYDDYILYDKETVEDIIPMAREFIKTIERLIDTK